MAHSRAMDISGTQLRAVRAALFTALVVTLSAASHVLLSRVPLPLATVAPRSPRASSSSPSRSRGVSAASGAIAALLIPLELAADTVFTTGPARLLRRRRAARSPARCAPSASTCCAAARAWARPLARMAGAGTAAAVLLAGAGAAAPPGCCSPRTSGSGLLAAAWLRRGERALAQLLRAVAAARLPAAADRGRRGDGHPAACGVRRAPGAPGTHDPYAALRRTPWDGVDRRARPLA